jgi:hypothetical protein
MRGRVDTFISRRGCALCSTNFSIYILQLCRGLASGFSRQICNGCVRRKCFDKKIAIHSRI